MRRDKLIHSLLRDSFLITLVDGVTFHGVLLDHDERSLVLSDAAQLAANGDRLRVDGLLIVDRARVAYLQRPPT